MAAGITQDNPYQDDWSPRDPQTGAKLPTTIAQVGGQPTSSNQTQPGGAQIPYGDPNNNQSPPFAPTGQVTGATPAQTPPAPAAPSYYNAQDPTHQAVMAAFQAKGIQPRDQADFEYWVKHINDSGGLANGYQATGGTGTWAQRMASGSGGVGDYREGGGGGNFGGGGGGNFFSYSGSGASQDPRWAGLYDQLLKRSQQSLAVDPNDPAIRAQTDAFDAQQVRANRQGLSNLAEAGGSNVNMSDETRRANESRGQNDAAFGAQLQAREIDARRTEIAQALSGQLGVLSAADAFTLKQEDQKLAAAGLALQSQLGNRGMDIQSQLGNRGYDISGRANDNTAAQNAWEDQYKLLFGQ